MMAYGGYGYKPAGFAGGLQPPEPPAPKPGALDPRAQMAKMMQALLKPDEGGGQTPDFTQVFGPTHHGD
jgi:hypothetical protein